MKRKFRSVDKPLRIQAPPKISPSKRAFEKYKLRGLFWEFYCIWNFVVGKSSLQEIATLAIIWEISDSYLETGRYGPGDTVQNLESPGLSRRVDSTGHLACTTRPKGYFVTGITRYPNSDSTFRLQSLLSCGDVSTNPGPVGALNSRSNPRENSRNACQLCERTVAPNHRV